MLVEQELQTYSVAHLECTTLSHIEQPMIQCLDWLIKLEQQGHICNGLL